MEIIMASALVGEWSLPFAECVRIFGVVVSELQERFLPRMARKSVPKYLLPKKGKGQGQNTAASASQPNAAVVGVPPVPAVNAAVSVPPLPIAAVSNAGVPPLRAPAVPSIGLPRNAASNQPLPVQATVGTARNVTPAIPRQLLAAPTTPTNVRTPARTFLGSPPPPPALHPSPPVAGAAPNAQPPPKPATHRYSSFLAGQHSPSPISPIFPVQQLPFNSTLLDEEGDTRINRERLFFCDGTCKEVDDFSIPKAPFKRLVKSIAEDYGDFRWGKDAITILQDVAEAYLEKLFLVANTMAHHGRRKTVNKTDLELALCLDEVLGSRALR